MNDFLNPILLLNLNNYWIKCDPVVKGFYFTLLSFCANSELKGTIDNDDETLRKLLNIPLPWSIREVNLSQDEAILKFLETNFSENNISQVMLDSLKEVFYEKSSGNLDTLRLSHEQWTNYLWINVWKPQLLTLWEVVDNKVTRKHQDLKPFTGKLWNETAYLLSQGKIPMQTANVSQNKKITKNKKENLPQINNIDCIFDYDDIGYNGIAWLHGDTENYEDLSKILKIWRTPATVQENNSIWDVGVALLSNSPQNYKSTRGLLGKLVQQYGSQLVAKAVAEMATKPNLPTDKISFLMGILKREVDGPAHVRKEREKRAKLVL